MKTIMKTVKAVKNKVANNKVVKNPTTLYVASIAGMLSPFVTADKYPKTAAAIYLGAVGTYMYAMHLDSKEFSERMSSLNEKIAKDREALNRLLGK